jgi:protein-tyrosine-phosphatase
MTQNILFVCEHGAAKSIVASAYFNKLAARLKSIKVTFTFKSDCHLPPQ